jgi:DNA mismatch repair ATPase MutL
MYNSVLFVALRVCLFTPFLLFLFFHTYIHTQVVSQERKQSGSCEYGDLFIIDQHASDEKHRYETLTATTVLQRQQLLLPKPLDDLSPLEEHVILENLPIFSANGFEFTVTDGQAEAPRLTVKALPHSKQISFGVSDIMALCQEIQTNPPGVVCKACVWLYVHVCVAGECMRLCTRLSIYLCICV